MMRAFTPSTYILAPRSKTPPSGTLPLLPIPLPTSSPPLLLPSTDRRADVPKAVLPPQKRLFIALGPRFKVEEYSSSLTARPARGFRADYGFVGTLDAEIRHDIALDPRFKVEECSSSLTARPARGFRADYGFVGTLDAEIRHDIALDPRFKVEECSSALTARPTGGFRADYGFVGTLDAEIRRDPDRKIGTARRGADSDEDITDSDGSTIEMETVFNISNCAIENQVKFANCTLHGVALTWWKSHVKTVGQDAAYDMPWNTLMKMITAKYYPQNEIKKLEMKIWELKVKGTDLTSYTQRF
nr:reverse transcriptase domain-containing protein [Tanacetum cinerariifolium]